MIDFKFNYPSIAAEKEILQNFLTSRTDEDLQRTLLFPPFEGAFQNTRALGNLLGFDWFSLTEYSSLVLCTSANQALSCLLQGLRPTHQHFLSEAFTYSTFKSITLQHQFQVLPISIDADGIHIESLAATVSATSATLLYLQPTLQNPTCSVLSFERREQLVSLAREKDLLLIEDDAYRFLHPDPPPTLLEMAPERTIHIFSLAKPFNPFAKIAFVILPKHLKAMLIDQVRFTSSGTSALLSKFAEYLLDTGALHSIIKAKQAVAQERQRFVQPLLEGLTYQTYPTSFHTWVKLPSFVNATSLTARLLAQEIQIVSGVDCTFDATGEQYIRLAFGAVSEKEKLENGLQVLRNMLSA